jgi:hypothetical protein
VKIAIVGLARSGKSTLFGALTGGRAHGAGHAPGLSSQVGVARIPDARLATLEQLFRPQKTVPAEVEYVDTASRPGGRGREDAIGGELLNHLMGADELLQVVRAFEDERVPHPQSRIDPARDVESFDLELTFSDLGIIDRRLRRLQESLKGATAHEQEHLRREEHLLQRVRSGVEQEVPVRKQDLSAEEVKELSGYQFLTAKPMLVALNIGEAQIPESAARERQLEAACSDLAVVAVCAKLELELQQLSEEEAQEFMAAMGLEASSLGRIIAGSFRQLGLITFFTTASDQLRAWTVPKGSTAPQAAGKVHSDMERGFIRADVISFSDMQKCGSLAEARRHGLLRTEGKHYVVQDGDIITFLFNV